MDRRTGKKLANRREGKERKEKKGKREKRKEEKAIGTEEREKKDET